jgi:hypothetical protein
MGRALVGAGASAALAASCVALAHCTNLSGLSAEDDAATPLADAADDMSIDADAAPDAGADASDADAMLPPGTIYCAGTNVTCDVTMTECCVTVTGRQTPPPRTVDNASARCGAIGGPNCGPTYGSAGTTYFMDFPTRCASAAECDAGAVCCATFPSQGIVGSIACSTAADCVDAGGRAICSSTCPGGVSCAPDPDPVLAQLYGGYCP